MSLSADTAWESEKGLVKVLWVALVGGGGPGGGGGCGSGGANESHESFRKERVDE